MATWVKYEHITNKKRVGECLKSDWDKSNKGGNLSTYFRIVSTFEKSDFVPKEAKEAIKAKEKENLINNQNDAVNE
jgi:predicted DNA-binding WGR domain protein